MGVSNTGISCCEHCGAQFRLFSIMNKDMQGLCKVWKKRHERGCSAKTPEQRLKWANKYVGKDTTESSITVDLSHPGFKKSNQTFGQESTNMAEQLSDDLNWKSTSKNTRMVTANGRHFCATRATGKSVWLLLETVRCMHDHGSSPLVDGMKWTGIKTDKLSETVLNVVGMSK